MDIIIFITGILIVISKFLDCYTTSVYIRSIGQERNPISRKLMELIGIKTSIWLIFGISIIIVIFSIYILYSHFNNIYYKVGFILIGMIVSIIQFAVAFTNHNKKLNFITKLLTKIYR